MSGVWPDGHRSAVLVTVNLDGERALLSLDPALAGMDKTLSTARYGLRHGVDAIASELEREGWRASWLAPGMLARTHGEVLARVGETHDVGIRGDDLERLDALGADERRAVLDRAVVGFEQIGLAPTGFRLPRGDWPRGLVDDLADRGIRWSSSFVADDLPFLLPGAAGAALVELPFHYAAEDRQAFEWNFSPALPSGHSRIASYDDVLENWIWEFEGTHHEGLLWVLTLHPHVIGTPGRIALLRELLAHIRSTGAVWVATGTEIAAWWESEGRARGLAHPGAVFLREAGWPSF